MTDVNKLITDNIDVWTSAIKKRNSQGRGSSKKIELTGIKKLRELILELAVRGKLVPQDHNDEPASVLLERFTEEKVQLVVDKKIKKPKVLPKIINEDKPFELPSGWEFERLENMTSLITKGSSPKWQGVSYTEDSTDVLFVTSENVGAFELRLDKKKFVEKKFNDVEPRSILQKHDFLMNIVGASIGRTATYNIDVLANINQAVCLIRSFPSLSCNKYFLTFFNSNICISYMYDKQVDNARPNLSMANICKFVIPVPPLAEQYRIVAKVDELMALCDQLEQQTEQSLLAHQTLVEVLLNTLTQSVNADDFQESWQRITDHFDVLFTTEASIDQLKQTILQLAVIGKLVPQKTSDEPASKLLEKIAEEKAQLIADKKIKKQKPLPAITDEEKLFELPNGWIFSKFGNIWIDSFYGPRFGKNEYVTNGGYPTIRTTDMTPEGSIILKDPPEVLVDDSKLELYGLSKGDLLITRSGSIGTMAIYDLDVIAIPSAYLIRVRLPKEMSPEFTLSMLMSPLGQKYLGLNTTSVGVPNVNASKMSEFTLPIPPLSEQHRIVTKVDELMALCDQLKTRLADAQITQHQLADAVVENALN